MANSPNRGNQPEPNTNLPSQRRVWRRIGIGLGLALCLGGVAGARWLWVFIQTDLVPTAERALSKSLDRPVELGELERFTLAGIRVGESHIPATPGDRDTVEVRAVEVRFNLFRAIWSRRLGLDVTLIQPSIYLDQTANGAWVKLPPSREPSDRFFKIKPDTLRVREGRVALEPHTPTTPTEKTEDLIEVNADVEPVEQPPDTQADLIVIEGVDGNLQFSNNEKDLAFQFAGQSITGGDLKIQGEALLTSNQTKLAIQAQNVLAPEVLTFAPLPLRFTEGRFWGNVELVLQRGLKSISGTARFEDAIATIRNVPNQFSQGQGQLRFTGRAVELDGVEAVYGSIPAEVDGIVNFDEGYDLSVNADSVAIADLLNTFKLQLPVSASGTLNGDLTITGALNQPKIEGVATNAGLIRLDRVNFAKVRSQFALTNSTLAFTEIEAIPVEGGQLTGNGLVSLGEGGQVGFDLQALNIPGDAIARPYGINNPSVRLGQVAADIQVTGELGAIETAIQWEAAGATYPGSGELLIAGNTLQLRNTRLRVAGGEVEANGDSINGRWQLLLRSTGVQLSQFSQGLRGLFSGDVRLTGERANLRPEAIRGEGTVQFSEGIALVERPITADVRWTGERLEVDRATAPGFAANGYVLAQLAGQGAPAITGLNLDVQLSNYDIAELPITLPRVQLHGLADFQGQLTGSLADLVADGQLNLNQLAVNDLTFEPQLVGDLRYRSNQSLTLDVTGQRDRVALQLDGQYRPNSFSIQQDNFTADGHREGDRLTAQVRNFPLQVLNLAPAAQQGVGEITGVLNGNFVVTVNDWSNPSLVGSVAVAQPALGYITADQFTGSIRYSNGVAVLTDGDLRQQDSRYQIVGSLSQTNGPEFRGQVTADQGQLDDLLTAFQWFDLQDLQRGIQPPTYASADAVEPSPVSVLERSLLTQLSRYSEVVELRNRQRFVRQQASILPPLEELSGTFSGNIDVASSPQEGLTVDFALTGEDWQWGNEYRAAQVTADGTFENGAVTLFPFRLQTGDRLVAFSGQVGGEQQQSGQLRIQNIPIEPLQEIVNVPIDLQGNLNATATLAGSLKNPQVLGELNLADARLNGTQVREARGIFGYNNARLNLNGRLVIDEPEPLTVTGSIPYPLPFMDTEPQVAGINLLPEINLSDDIQLDINVRNEGLQLINILSNGQLLWNSGNGEVDVEVRGTLKQPLAIGTAVLTDSVISSPLLPQPLTNVTGQIDFDSDLIQVRTLQGEFSDGQVSAEGYLPIFLSNRTPNTETQPLTVALDRVLLDYTSPNQQRQYNGQVDGNLLIAGSALSPQISGDVFLSDGQIFLPETSGPIVTAPAVQAADELPTASLFKPLRLEDLDVYLNRNVVITSNIVRIGAKGMLTVNGTLDNLRPDGVIDLTSGQINLFTTSFNLDRRYDNKAVFTPTNGLIPELQVQLITSVPEISGGFAAVSPISASETAAQSLSEYSTLQTIRVQATVNGRADRIFDNLELTSSPRRSENEIVALLGGGFVDTLGRGDVTLAIANFAGSALLNRVQNFINNALGISDFRLFPTTVTSEDDRTSSLGLAAELGVNITPDFSVSALQILTDERVPTQFNLRYRINDEFQFRGSTNLSNDNRVILEYETRF